MSEVPANFDGLDDLDSAPVASPDFLADQANRASFITPKGARDVPRDKARFAPCKNCNGTGMWSSYSGWNRKRCFRCNGTGNGLSMAPAAVATRQRAAVAKAEADMNRATSALDFIEANPDIKAWWDANKNFEFAQSTKAALFKYGSLTAGQLSGIRKCIDGEASRKQAREESRIASSVDVSGAGFTKLLEGFTRAKVAGLKHPKMRFESMTFSMAKPTGANAGFLYIKGGEGGFGAPYFGKISPMGQFSPSRDCPEEIRAEIKRIGSDPLGEAVAYGKKTGNCCCCGRPLENELSVELGIGPICRAKWFGGAL